MLSHYPTAMFGLLWSAFSVAGVVQAGRGGQTAGIVFFLLFVGVGVFMLAMPLVEYRRASGTLIAITERRFLMVTRHGCTVRSVDLSAIRQVERIRKRGGITLRIPTALISNGDGGQKVDYTDLHGLADAEKAYRLLTQRST